MFQACDESDSNNGLVYDLLEHYVFSSIISPRSGIQKLGLECLAIHSLNNKMFGCENFDLMLKSFVNGKKSIKLICLKFFFDWILINGMTSLTPEQSALLIDVFQAGLDPEDEPFLALTVEGLCKCLIWDRLDDDSVILI